MGVDKVSTGGCLQRSWPVRGVSIDCSRSEANPVSGSSQGREMTARDVEVEKASRLRKRHVMSPRA